MSEKHKRDKDNERINELFGMIEPARNEHIAREALEIASKWLGKAERQAKELVELQGVRPVLCKDCKHASRCYGDLLMASRGGGFIHQPLDYCSYGERKDDI